jgi:hypothetical protein
MRDLYCGPGSGDLSEVLDCEALGLVSPKACDWCDLRRKGKCPQGKTMT